MTVESDEEGSLPEKSPSGKKSKKLLEAEEALLDPDFTFDATGDLYDDILDGRSSLQDLVKQGTRPVCLILLSLILLLYFTV